MIQGLDDVRNYIVEQLETTAKEHETVKNKIDQLNYEIQDLERKKIQLEAAFTALNNVHTKLLKALESLTSTSADINTEGKNEP